MPKIDTKGTSRIPEPISLATSKNVYVVFPLITSNSGTEIVGSPAGTFAKTQCLNNALTYLVHLTS